MNDLPRLFYSDYGKCDCYIPPHTHNSMEWIWIKNGTFRAAFQNGNILVGKPGDIFVIPAGVRHDQSAVPDGANIFALLEGCGDNDPDSAHIIHTEKDTLIGHFFESLPLLCKEMPSRSEHGYLLQAIRERMKHYSSNNTSFEFFHPGLERAVAYIQKNYMKNISMPELAAYANVSQSHLNLLFRQHFKHGAVHYMTRVRLEHARELLKNPYAAISEAALKSGFADGNYFSRLFRKVYGFSPSEYRNTIEKNQPK